MQNNVHFSSDEACPVSDDFLGDLYRSGEHGLSLLVGGVGSETRAKLALYCYRRAHLHDIGLAIAATCSEADLESLGTVGAVLYSRSREAPPKRTTSYQVVRRMVTLANGPIQSFQSDYDSTGSSLE